jgi:DNA-directed RNA polymerase beta subunit
MDDTKNDSDDEKSPLVLAALEELPVASPEVKPRLIGDNTLKIDDLLLVTDAEIQEKTLVNHHVESMNDLYLNGIHQIITQIFKVEKDLENKRTNTPEDLEIEKIHVEVNFTDVFLSRPTMINYFSGKEEVLYPKVALLEDKTYSANLRVNANIKAIAYLKNGSTKVKEDEIKNFKICRIPIMVRSVMCNTHGCSKEALINLKEDPNDPGGYFIIKGVEWVIDCIENILFNQIRIFKNDYNKEVIRAEFISKPGDSYQNMAFLIIRWLSDGQITVEIVRDKLRGIYIPFYLVFRVLGWTTDKQIFDNITYGAADTDSISKNMINYLRTGFTAKYPIMQEGRHIYKQNEVLKVVADELKRDSLKYLELDTNSEAYKQAFRIIHREFDINFLPHVGSTSETRHRKLRFLALVIRRMFLVKMGNLQPTDRDAYRSKRIHPAGVSYAKPLKTYFNASIVQQIKRRLVKDFKAMSFSQINLAASVKSSVYGADFERLITQAITSGNRAQLTVNVRRKVTNRLSSQLLNRHNQLSVYSTLRQVTTTSSDNSKQSERASEMRRVHMTFMGYICVAHSPEGEKTGINKQMAISATVCKASSSEVIKDMLRSDPAIMPDNEVFPEMISSQKLSNIYVNGDWIGCTKDTIALVTKYRNMRRNLELDPYLTIHWENTQDEIYFWADVGRMMRPLLIVYNNQRDPKEFTSKEQKGKFRQGLALNSEHIRKMYQKKTGINDLLRERVIEYVSPEEQENYFICPNLDQLNDDEGNELNEYTHCDIAQNILGITALTSPYAHHNAVPRLAYQTSQAKQTCGLFALNWPYRCDKDTFLQYQCETPIIRTLSNKYTFPNGANIMCAIMCNTGLLISPCRSQNYGKSTCSRRHY